MKPIIGITMGDGSGVGPELILKAFSDLLLFQICRPLLIGRSTVMNYYRDLLEIDVTMHPISTLCEARFEPGTLDLLDIQTNGEKLPTPGLHRSDMGAAAVAYTQAAGRLALDDQIDAMVSAPLNKESMRMAGFKYEGVTQILGELTGSSRYGMILLLGSLRVMMLTTHISLRQACNAVTREKVLTMLELADESLRFFGIENPKIAVAGLNPHAGEGGLFGREEIEGSVPAIKDARHKGIDAIGPIPADVVFVQARDGDYDLVLAMYHDQANIAVKLLGFGEVVTVLAGIPIIRTSVGHGTAFDIAGKGIANPTNFIKAINAAVEFAVLRKERQYARTT